MIHSKILEETALWKVYDKEAGSESRRRSWVREIYEAAAKYMLDVRSTFQNYTLHDETHILNVLDAMGGLLGDRISQLTVGELELLILAACLHDLGMVYTDREKQRWYQNETACKKFLREYKPELLGISADAWPEDVCQWYLRTLHPFRIPEVLRNKEWKELFDKRPLESVPKDCILAVCKAHGEKPKELSINRNLEYLSANDVDPLFCALLLRLGDLLDFDDTRAPRVLYGYIVNNEKSREEWDKHQASAGFRYPASPSVNDLPYKAHCTNPGVEHAVRDFLDWVDEELGNCFKLQRYCRTGWHQEFPFPRAIVRDEIESDGYMSGDFCLTMDQTQILKLLTGENLYDDADVFIRELLQNAIDATLLRGEMDSGFIPEESRIDLWEWNDKDGNIWFRIDDQGTGMTLGMLQRYFLKVGNSYYTSRELEQDLRDHNCAKRYQGISRFGIGFLSCFLCGDYAEVSTRYFNAHKNSREESAIETYRTVCYGLRLQVTGLSGYYTLRNQSQDHQTDEPFPTPDHFRTDIVYTDENDGYRDRAGTSIAIRLDPGKLGALDLRKTVETYLCAARVPVFYNGKRIGRTYEEVMRTAHEMAGETIYELTPEMKKEFDQKFPAVQGQYPKISVTVIPLDIEDPKVLPEFSGLIVKYKAYFDMIPMWKVKDQAYELNAEIYVNGLRSQILFQAINRTQGGFFGFKWQFMKESSDLEAITLLETEFEKFSSCPKTEELLGETWRPFAGKFDLKEAWIAYIDYQQNGDMSVSIEEDSFPTIASIVCNNRDNFFAFVYHGIMAGDLRNPFFGSFPAWDSAEAIFFLGDIWKPKVEVSRSNISELPLEVLVAITGILNKYQLLSDAKGSILLSDAWRNSSLKKWRKVRTDQLDQWMMRNEKNFFEEKKQRLQEAVKIFTNRTIVGHDTDKVLQNYLQAWLQDNYRMTINYEKGQIISFYEKEESGAEDIFDLFPPMMFCWAADDRSRRYICCKNPDVRRGITLDHPFIVWLLDNATQLKKYYERQFRQIVDCLCNDGAEGIIQTVDSIRKQLADLPEHHGVDIGALPKLSMDDFWKISVY